MAVDFDWTLIDDNSDTYIVEMLGGKAVMDSLRPTMQWTQLMDRMMVELRVRGQRLKKVDTLLKQIPLHPPMARAMRAASEAGCSLHIISDANSRFIATVLRAHDLINTFSSVHTNPASNDPSGTLRISPYYPDEPAIIPPHTCPLCPPNMCKGLILDHLLSRESRDKLTVIYLGDGGGDYCPSLRLQKEDHVLARAGFPLQKRLQQTDSQKKPKASIRVWDSAEDVERILGELIEDLKSKPTST